MNKLMQTLQVEKIRENKIDIFRGNKEEPAVDLLEITLEDDESLSIHFCRAIAIVPVAGNAINISFRKDPAVS
jgi:hypothetical protein